MRAPAGRLMASCALALLLIGSASAEIPQTIGYQGRVTDNGGNPVADGTWPMRFRIYDAQSGGSLVWDSGTHPTTTSGGVFSVMLGESPHPTLGLAFDQDYWLLVTFDSEDQSPRRRLGSVGYAYMASGLVPGTQVIGSLSDPSMPAAAVVGGNTAGGFLPCGLWGSSISGAGVYGTAEGSTDWNFGVYGSTYSMDGDGVHGTASATTGPAYGGYFESASTSGRGLYAQATAAGGTTYGVYGRSVSTTGTGVYGIAEASTGINYGVQGVSESLLGVGVYGEATATAGFCYGVLGTCSSLSGAGVVGVGPGYSPSTGAAPSGGWFGCDWYGITAETNDGFGVRALANSTTGSNYAVHAISNSSSGTAVLGMALASTGMNWGVCGLTQSSGGYGVVGESQYGTAAYGIAYGTTGLNVGVRGQTDSNGGWGVYGYSSETSGNSVAVRGKCESAGAYAGYFVGDVYVSGSINKSACSFLIDHPLDPENRLLRHNCMESPEHLVVYRGRVRLNADGEAAVQLPGYFRALTKEDEATIHLTAEGGPFVTGYTWSEGNAGFTAYGEPDREVSWMVMAERDDPVIRRLARPVEEDKGPDNKYCDRGKLLEPVAYGYPETMGQDYDSDPGWTDDTRRQLERRRREVRESQYPNPPPEDSPGKASAPRRVDSGDPAEKQESMRGSRSGHSESVNARSPGGKGLLHQEPSTTLSLHHSAAPRGDVGSTNGGRS